MKSEILTNPEPYDTVIFIVLVLALVGVGFNEADSIIDSLKEAR